MKKLFLALVLVVTAMCGVFAQSAYANESEQTLVKINVIQLDQMPKVFTSQNPSLMGKKLLCEGSGEGYVPNTMKYIGLNKNAVQKINLTGEPLEFNLDVGNKGLTTLGMALSTVGALALGGGLGFLMVGITDDSIQSVLPMVIGCAVPGVVGLCVGFPLAEKNKPKFTLVTKN